MLSVLKCCVPKTLAFAFGLRLRSKTRCFKTRVLGRRLANGKPQERLRFREERLRFRALRSKTLAFKKRIAIVRFKDFPRCHGLRLGRLRSKHAASCVCVSKPAKISCDNFERIPKRWALVSLLTFFLPLSRADD